MTMTTSEKITKLRQFMKEAGIDIYIIPTADYHQSEYVGDYFKAREFLTGFTGSAGTAVVTQKEACLWTDGRYFIQAAAQLQETEILLKKQGEPNVPEITEYLEENLKENGTIGFDGRTIGVSEGKRFQKIAEKKKGTILYEQDLIDVIWNDRPELSKKPAFSLELKYAGESTAEKLRRIRAVMEEKQATMQLVTGLDDIGWVLNLRGRDVEYFPLLLSYLIIRKEEAELYVDADKLDASIKDRLAKDKIHVYNYNSIYERVKNIPKNETVLLDSGQVNFALFQNIPSEVRIIEEENPIILMKAVKNETEVENIRKAHIKDGVAHTKFMYWLKTTIGKEKITEISAAEKLESFRAGQEGYLWQSFEPICAYKDHGAIVHYSATPETNAELKAEGLFLTDTGGNYREGSTDITRTVALGEISEEEKTHFTIVVSSMLTLADAVFLYGCTGMNLDYAARAPFWKRHLNFNHGTGHGVGYLGNIHEAPQRFHWKFHPDAGHKLEENMVITDEPGIYIENSHGIRIENELLVRKDVKNEYGQFMRFEPLTFVPIDLDAIDAEQLTAHETELLNAYHKKVYEVISPYLTAEEKEWLKEYTLDLKENTSRLAKKE